MSVSRIGFIKTKAFKMGATALCVAAVAGGVTAGVLQSSPADAAQTVTYKPWSFGIISDTQWTVTDDGFNPNYVAANQIKQIDQQFVKAGVKLVVAVGDTADNGAKVALDTRALYAQDLYNAGIGFYPLRGNHEATEGNGGGGAPGDGTYLNSAGEFAYLFPQIGTGMNNNTPAAITTSLIPAADLSKNAPAKKMGKTFTVGSNWSAPTTNSTNKALSYSFRYNNATFVLLDQFDNAATDPNVYYNSTIGQQQSWIDGVLSSRPAGTQAFVFTHKNLLGGNHKDNLFGGPVGAIDGPVDPLAGKDPGDGSGMDLSKLTATQLTDLNNKNSLENAFLASMQQYSVPFVISGHDHMDYESLVTSQDGASKVHQLICASDSSKFYTPTLPVSANDAPVQQDLDKVGYYIVTVDGPLVTIDYYADPTGDSDYGLNGATFDFEKIASTSYSLNGTEKLVAEGASYAPLTDNTTKAATMGTGFLGTSMSILSGKNGSTAYAQYFASGTPGSLTALTKKMNNDVNTGWEPAESRLASDILDLSGMSKSLGSTKTDEYVLSVSYHQTPPSGFNTNGTFGLLTRNANGQWVKAVGQNLGASQKFVLGAWNSSYTLGTYGVDPATHTAWAVLNYNGDFAVGQSGK